MKKILNLIGSLFKKLWLLIINDIWLVIGFAFTWIIPIYLLNEKIALTKNADVGTKLSFAGLLVALFVIIKFYKKIEIKINAIEPRNTISFIGKTFTIVLLRCINLAVILGVFVYCGIFIQTIIEWYTHALISIGIGLVFYIIRWCIKFATKQVNTRTRMLIRYILSSKDIYALKGKFESENIAYLNELSYKELKSLIVKTENIKIKTIIKQMNAIRE